MECMFLFDIWLLVNMQLSVSGNTWLIWSKSLAVTQKCLPDLYNSQKCINMLYKEMRDVQPNMAFQLYFTIYFKSHNKMEIYTFLIINMVIIPLE